MLFSPSARKEESSGGEGIAIVGVPSDLTS